MRWSLILSTFIAVQSTLSFGCVALAIPPTSGGLERRAKDGVKASSKEYRDSGQFHQDAYHVANMGPKGKITPQTTVTKQHLKHADRAAYGKQKVKEKGIQADHVFESQMVHKHLQKHNLQFDKLHPDLQKKVKNIVNGPKNMALIPGSINQSKGQLVKHGMNGKQIKSQKAHPYAKQSYKTAKGTAKSLDKAFKAHGHDFKGNTFHNTLHKTYEKAGVIKPGQTKPGTRPRPPKSKKTGTASGKAGPSKAGPSKGGPAKGGPAKGGSSKAKPAKPGPVRKSTRIAANNANKKTGKK